MIGSGKRFKRFHHQNDKQQNRVRLRVEELEPRTLLSATPTGLSPIQVRQAYGFNQITFNNGTIQGDGSGQTIAIVDAYNDPHIISDLSHFDSTFGLPSANLTVENQSGGKSLPHSNMGWALEISLDVEWAHAIAPGAKLLLVEANSASYTNLFAAVTTAAKTPGVVVVSMSFGGGEFSGETSYDSVFSTPSGHIGGNNLPGGITFVASSGDNGSGVSYPSASPNVLSVGGTTLNVDSQGNYISETGWSGSGGGNSTVESEPTYQQGVQSSGKRGNPDVAYVADPNTGVSVYDTFGYGGWITVGGTSAGAPQWAALIAIADQGRALAGKGSLGNAQAAIYTLPSSDFHDITSGSNGAYSAGTGYDLVTGRGSPKAILVVAGLLTATSAPSAANHNGPSSNSGTGGKGTANLGVLVLASSVDAPTSSTGTVPGGSVATSASIPVLSSANPLFTVATANFIVNQPARFVPGTGQSVPYSSGGGGQESLPIMPRSTGDSGSSTNGPSIPLLGQPVLPTIEVPTTPDKNQQNDGPPAPRMDQNQENNSGDQEGELLEASAWRQACDTFFAAEGWGAGLADTIGNPAGIVAPIQDGPTDTIAATVALVFLMAGHQKPRVDREEPNRLRLIATGRKV